MSQTPVVFFPGLAADERLWQPVIDRLGDAVHPIHAPCAGDTIADWADEVLEQAPDGFYVAGTSMGGYAALEVALRGDPRLAGLILLNTNARAASPPQLQRGADVIEQIEAGHLDEVAVKVGGLVSGGKPDVAELAAVMMRSAGADTFVRQQKAVLARKDRRAELPNISVRTLVIAGDSDVLAPPSLNNEIARLIPDAELEIFACGHMSTAELPHEVAEAIGSWLARR